MRTMQVEYLRGKNSLARCRFASSCALSERIGSPVRANRLATPDAITAGGVRLTVCELQITLRLLHRLPGWYAIAQLFTPFQPLPPWLFDGYIRWNVTLPRPARGAGARMSS